MGDEPAVLCTICARGGSTGVPNKNIREVDGTPLIGYSIQHALEWSRITDVVVSTDSDEIADIAREHGAAVPFKRPDRLATDDAAKIPVIQHAHEEMEARTEREYDYVVDVSVTGPLRNVQDIEDCFQQVHGTRATNAYTVTEAEVNPYFNMVELDDDGYAELSKDPGDDVVRRQDAPAVYAMNASVYVYEPSFLQTTNTVHGDRTRVSVMPPERSVDVDRPIDLAFVEFLIQSEVSPS